MGNAEATKLYAISVSLTKACIDLDGSKAGQLKYYVGSWRRPVDGTQMKNVIKWVIYGWANQTFVVASGWLIISPGNDLWIQTFPSTLFNYFNLKRSNPCKWHPKRRNLTQICQIARTIFESPTQNHKKNKTLAFTHPSIVVWCSQQNPTMNDSPCAFCSMQIPRQLALASWLLVS